MLKLDIDKFYQTFNKLDRLRILKQIAQYNIGIDRKNAIVSSDCAVKIEIIKQNDGIFFYSNSDILMGFLTIFSDEFNQNQTNFETWLVKNNLQSFLTFDKKNAILKLLEKV